MQIVDLNDELKDLYLICLEDWSSEMKEAGSHKQIWFDRMKEKGLRVKLAIDDNGKAGGMIQYAPAEHSIIEGKNIYFVYCIWVHGHKQGRGNFQRKGMGKALLRESENDIRNSGGGGMACWGISLPFWMKASWFRKHGYKVADKNGLALLLWKPFLDSLEPPKWIKRKKIPEPIPGKVTVTAFVNGWCQVQNIIFERARRASLEFGDKVDFRGISTLDRDVFIDWGISDGLYIDGREVSSGPPPSYEKIRNLIEKKVRKLK